MSCPCCGCNGTCVKNPDCQQKGESCYCVNAECKSCSGPCDADGDCQTPCRCYQGGCVGKCSGPCDNNTECATGCICSFGQCVRCDGCFAPTNCTLTATLTYSDATTVTLTYPDVGDGPDLLQFSFGTCRVIADYSDIDAEGNPAPGSASKSVELICKECCADGSGRDCSLGDVVNEFYTPAEFKRITNIEFSLACDPSADPCNPLP